MTTKLVCTVGIGNYYQTNYRFGEVSKKTKFAPIAVGCCAIGPTEDLELVALLTVEAEEEYGDQLETETEAQGWTYTPVRIPAGRCEEELWQIFDAFGQGLEQGDGLVLDLTHGFRHIPALLLSATQYYVVRKNLKLFGIFYGAYVNGEKDTSILDLTALHDLSKWTYGARLMEDYRLSTPLGEMLDEIQTRSHKDPRYQRSRFTKLQRVGKSLKDLESPLVSGIPLETGFEARRALENVRSGKEEIKRIPPMKEPWRELEEELERVKLQNPGHKKDVLLTLEELKRQSLLIAGYLRSGNLTAAANLLREWLVSTIIFHSGDTENWLDYGKRRKPVEMRLGALSEWNKPGSFKEALTAEQKQVLALWK